MLRAWESYHTYSIGCIICAQSIARCRVRRPQQEPTSQLDQKGQHFLFSFSVRIQTFDLAAKNDVDRATRHAVRWSQLGTDICASLSGVRANEVRTCEVLHHGAPILCVESDLRYRRVPRR